MNYVYCYLSYFGFKAGRATMNGFWAEMDRLGKDRNPYQAGFLQFVGVADPANRPSTFMPRQRNTSMDVACTSIRNGPRRPDTPARPASAPASRARSRVPRMPV